MFNTHRSTLQAKKSNREAVTENEKEHERRVFQEAGQTIAPMDAGDNRERKARRESNPEGSSHCLLLVSSLC